MSQRITELRAEIGALEEELAAATHPRTRAPAPVSRTTSLPAAPN